MRNVNTKAHVTGERNNSNVKGDVMTPDRGGNINLIKNGESNHTFLFGITLLVLLIVELLFGFYMLNEFKIYKQEVNIKIEEQNRLIKQFIAIYGD